MDYRKLAMFVLLAVATLALALPAAAQCCGWGSWGGWWPSWGGGCGWGGCGLGWGSGWGGWW